MDTPTPQETPNPGVTEAAAEKTAEKAQDAASEAAAAKLTYKQLLRKKRIEMGVPVGPEPLEYKDHALMEEGATVLHKLYDKVVILHPPNPSKYSTEKPIVKKWGVTAVHEEAGAMRIAEAAGISVPHVYAIETAPDGRHGIVMDYIEGTTLQAAWPSLDDDQKRAVVLQLRAILEIMHSLTPPPNHIGGPRPGDPIWDTRLMLTETAPAAKDEAGFNDYLISGLFRQCPKFLVKAFADVLRTDHRIVFTHADLAPRNIMYKDGQITGIIDWQTSGWYPEHWEYVKFFHRCSGDGLRHLADDIFPQSFPLDLVHYIAILRWQVS